MIMTTTRHTQSERNSLIVYLLTLLFNKHKPLMLVLILSKEKINKIKKQPKQIRAPSSSQCPLVVNEQ